MQNIKTNYPDSVASYDTRLGNDRDGIILQVISQHGTYAYVGIIVAIA